MIENETMIFNSTQHKWQSQSYIISQDKLILLFILRNDAVIFQTQDINHDLSSINGTI